MGYRSDVVIGFALTTKEQIDEVLAIYQMHPFVQKYDLAKDWQVHDWGGLWGLTYHAEGSKWYESYEDVQGFEHMLSVVQTFAEERGREFPYAYRKIRIGEEYDDIETVTLENLGTSSADLVDELYDRMNVRREIETNF